MSVRVNMRLPLLDQVFVYDQRSDYRCRIKFLFTTNAMLNDWRNANIHSDVSCPSKNTLYVPSTTAMHDARCTMQATAKASLSHESSKDVSNIGLRPICRIRPSMHLLTRSRIRRISRMRLSKHLLTRSPRCPHCTLVKNKIETSREERRRGQGEEEGTRSRGGGGGCESQSFRTRQEVGNVRHATKSLQETNAVHASAHRVCSTCTCTGLVVHSVCSTHCVQRPVQVQVLYQTTKDEKRTFEKFTFIA